MLSTISSFLPPALQLGNQEKNNQKVQDKDTDSDTNPNPASNGVSNDMSVDEHGIKKKRDRTHEVRLYHIQHPPFTPLCL